MGSATTLISRGDLRRSKPQDVKRLAKYLRLRIHDGMSHRNIANLVYWRISRVEYGKR